MSSLNDIIHQPVRLKIMAVLTSLEKGTTIDFTYLKNLLDLSDGNLGSHIRKLEDHGYVLVEKTFVGRKPKSYISATDKGSADYKEYVKHLQKIIGT